MTNRISKIVWSFLLFTFFSGCDKASVAGVWPPIAPEMRLELNSMVEVLEKAEHRMEVQSFSQLDSLPGGDIRGFRNLDGMNTYEEPEDIEFWNQLFQEISIDHISKRENGYQFSRAESILVDERSFLVIFSHDVTMKLFKCNSAQANVLCGYCGEEHIDDWATIFYWTPAQLAEELTTNPSDAKFEEAFARIDEEIDACMADGFLEMEGSEVLMLGVSD